MQDNILKVRKSLKSKLLPIRYEHTLSVSYTCMALAMRYGYDLDKAELAGLLHDCAKCYDESTIIEKCKKKKIPITEAEQQAPAVLHAKLGAWMAKEKYGVEDPEILNAISCHTTGRPQMTLLDKLLYTADYIEPRRFKADNLDDMRRLAFEDLDEAVFRIMQGTLQYLQYKGSMIDPMSMDAYRYYQEEKSRRYNE